MGRLFLVQLEENYYSCKHCSTPLALAEDIISKSFHCRHGIAYLYEKVVNVTFGEKEERMMITGMHTVVDLFCVKCGSIVGWKYEAAREKNQKYKVGKFILERFMVTGPPDESSHSQAQEAVVVEPNPLSAVVIGGTDSDDDDNVVDDDVVDDDVVDDDVVDDDLVDDDDDA